MIDLTAFGTEVVKFRLQEIAKDAHDFPDRQFYLNAGRHMGHSTLALNLLKNKEIVQNKTTVVIGPKLQSLERYKQFANVLVTPKTMKRMKEFHNAFIIVDDYKWVKKMISNLHEEIQRTQPFFTVFLQ